MKQLLLISALLLATSAQAQDGKPLKLEPLPSMPNANNSLTWGNYASAKALKAKYESTYLSTYQASIDKQKAEEEVAKISTCNSLSSEAAVTCAQAIQLERTSTSAVMPVKIYLAAAMQAKGDDREKVMELAAKGAAKRMTQDRFVSLLGEVCNEMKCE